MNSQQYIGVFLIAISLLVIGAMVLNFRKVDLRLGASKGFGTYLLMDAVMGAVFASGLTLTSQNFEPFAVFVGFFGMVVTSMFLGNGMRTDAMRKRWGADYANRTANSEVQQ